MKPVSAFPLRLRDSGLRELVRVVAEHDHVSQNELIEQSLANELLIRGAMIAADLELATRHLVELADEQYEQVVARSLGRFAEGESYPEPLQAYALDPSDVQVYRGQGADTFGAMAAFNAAGPVLPK